VTVLTVEKLKFGKSKIAVDAILKNIKIISSAVQAIFMKFGPMTHLNLLDRSNH